MQHALFFLAQVRMGIFQDIKMHHGAIKVIFLHSVFKIKDEILEPKE